MTFHAACARMLRAEAPRLGLHAPVHDLRPGRRAAAGQALPRRARRRPEALHARRGPQPDLRREEQAARRRGLPPARRLVLRADRRRRLRALRARDAPRERDGLRRPARPRGQRPRALPGGPRPLPARFRHVLVDEYQDTNHAQYRLLQLLAGEHRNLAVVGDDAQSIYGFRGADIRNILDFEDDFPDATVVKLEQNYRSTQTILERRERGHRQQPRAEAQVAVDRPRRGRPDQASASSTTSTPRRGSSSARSSGSSTRALGRAEIAVFYRTNAQSRVLEDTLVRREIAYQVIGGTKFYERAEIKDAIAYLTCSPTRRTSSRSRAIANSPRRGIGQTSLSRVLAHAATMGIPVWDAAADPAAVPGLGTAAQKALGRFMETMEALRERVAQQRAGRRPARGRAARDRLPRRARGRAHDRGAGPDGEPRGARRGRARVRRDADPARPRTARSTSSCSRSRSSPTPTRAATTRASSRS